MKRTVRYSTLTLALLAGSAAHARDLPNFNAYDTEHAAAPAAQPRAGRTPPAGITSTDARRGVPTFLWAPRGQIRPPQVAAASPEAAARAHLAAYAPLWHLSPEALASVVVRDVHDTGRGGIIVTFGQEVSGLPVHRTAAKVLMKRDLELVAISGALHPSAVPLKGNAGAKRSRAFRLAAPEAIARALQDLYGAPFKPQDLVDRKQQKAGYGLFDLSPAGAAQAANVAFTRPARVKPVLYPLPDRLVPGYFVEILAGDPADRTSDAYAYVVAADDGRLLYRENLTHNASYNYRVWAETSGTYTPLDGPHADFTPHPTGTPDGSAPQFTGPSLVSMEGFNTNPDGVADPWLDANATQTLGNNVDAYADLYGADGFSPGDIRATTTGPLTFDRVYDTAVDPVATQNQSMAAVTQIFFVTNWLHDWYYDSGFDESAGNAQQSNFGRGGEEGDPLLAEAQDGALQGPGDNANMQAMADGTSPIMQMYTWTGAGVQSVSVTPLNVTFGTGTATFGPQSFDLTGQLALANDGVSVVTDACQALTNTVAGRVALIDRGQCNFDVKVLNAQAAGAIGVLLANNVANEGPPGMGGSGNINIPVLSITKADGDALKAALLNGAVNVTLQRSAAVVRDGTIDNTIVAHEWGHYIHLRLVGCGNQQCGAMSEGWGDFIALHMAVREGDDLTGAFPLAGYATASFADYYFGIRRAPYSTSFDVNALSFRHISQGETPPQNHPWIDLGNMAESHNAGEIWTAMLFSAYAELLQAHPFAEARRLMSDYVVGGLKMAPADPTFTEQRDGILAAAAASDLNDVVALANGFALRGAGTCAASPPKDSTNLAGVVERFEVSPDIAFLSAKLDDAIVSCDSDGRLDAQERGRVTLEILNRGAGPLTDAQATISTTYPGVSFPGGTNVTFGTIPPFSVGTATVEVTLDESVVSIEHLDLDMTITSAETCTPTTQSAVVERVNYDETPASSATDTVESSVEVWSILGAVGPEVWSRAQIDAADHVWKGIDFPSISDTNLESPDLEVSTTAPFVMSFVHRHSFEFSQGENWDGSVIEVSTNGGATWQDISQYGNAGYGGTIGNQAENPLMDRQGYVSQNPSWPGTDTVTIDMGTALAGQTVRVRFRIGTDQAAGDEGWEIDDIAFQGIVNTPFSSVVPDAADCLGTPIADAGPDQTVAGGDNVALDASGSSDPENDPLGFVWTQVDGPAVELAGADAVGATFIAPEVDAETALTFQVTVSDGNASASDQVVITVRPGDGTKNAPPIEIVDGCGCSVPGDETPAKAPLAPFAALAALLLGARRRRARR